MAYLVVKNGPEAGKTYVLTQEVYVLGRHPDCDIIIDVGAVSRTHCKLTANDGHFLIEDLGARNRTYLNETQLQPHVPIALTDLAQIRVCDVVLTFHATLMHSDDWPAAVLIHDDYDDDVADSEADLVFVHDHVKPVWARSVAEGACFFSARALQRFATLVWRCLDVSARPAAELHALREVSDGLAKLLSLDGFLSRVLEALFRVFVQADHGFIGLVESDGNLIPKWIKSRGENSSETIRVSRNMAQRVMETKEAILSADAENDSWVKMNRSIMCAPLLDSDDKAFGILQIDTLDQMRRFNEADLEVFAAMAVAVGQIAALCSTPSTWDDVLRLAWRLMLEAMPNAHRCMVARPDEAFPRHVRVRWNSNELQAECERLNALLQRCHVHSPLALLSGFQAELADASHGVRDILGRGFNSVVVLDGRKGFDSTGKFTADEFYRHAIEEFDRILELGLDSSVYHPEEIAQILRDESRSLICVLNVHLIPTDALGRLRGLTQEHHQTLFCGPHDFGLQQRRNLLIDEANRDFGWESVRSIVRLCGQDPTSIHFPGDSRDSEVIAAIPTRPGEVTSLIASPIPSLSRGRAGVLYLDTSMGARDFRPDDVPFVESVANVLAFRHREHTAADWNQVATEGPTPNWASEG